MIDNLIEAMLKNSSSKLLSGDYSQAIDETTKYLSGVEGLEPGVKINYLPLIPKLYGYSCTELLYALASNKR